MDKELLVKLQHFFVVDNMIKREIYNMVPPNDEGYLYRDSILEYTNNLDDMLAYVFSELKCIAIDVFGRDSEAFNKIRLLESATNDKFYACGFDIDKLRLFYNNYISNMRSEFVNMVKDRCVGYALKNRSEIIDNILTINEMLHFLHSYILNSERFLQAVPMISEKKNDYNYPIVLRGAETPFFNKLFEDFPLDLDCGWTDMVAINDKKLIMMVRDRGHALSIEVTLNNGIARIEYFIPKLCNIDMINQLPGINNKVNKDSVGATGIVEVPIEELNTSLFDFISRVPMDSDMIIEQHHI